ncbi:MAG: DUF1934 domain-containing protein [Ruminococcaceae bacterium]|nr:DUF1934 domain-containing protein [Oscillospiraceae bacterium]
MNEALITVTGYQYVNGEEDCIELKTLGKFGVKNDKYYIQYTESTENDETCDTLIKVSKNETIITKKGATDNRMVIEKGKRNTCFYSSCGAVLMLDIYGMNTINNLNSSGGSLCLEYEISINSVPVSQNKIEITVKEV